MLLFTNNLPCAGVLFARDRMDACVNVTIETDISSIDYLYVKYVPKKVKCILIPQKSIDSLNIYPVQDQVQSYEPCHTELMRYRKSFTQKSIHL